jgi:hypothetical protein
MDKINMGHSNSLLEKVGGKARREKTRKDRKLREQKREMWKSERQNGKMILTETLSCAC